MRAGSRGPVSGRLVLWVCVSRLAVWQLHPCFPLPACRPVPGPFPVSGFLGPDPGAVFLGGLRWGRTGYLGVVPVRRW